MIKRVKFRIQEAISILMIQNLQAQQIREMNRCEKTSKVKVSRSTRGMVYEEGLSEALEDLSALLGREDEVGILLNVFDELRLIL